MITFQVTKEMSQEEWEDHVMGSGAWSWEWWYEVKSDDTYVTATWYTDLDHNEQLATSCLTFQEIADVASELAKTHPVVRQQLMDDDFDAAYMDCVLQQAFIEEIRYG